uniref:Uncharacterized protein n=1 Tax=Brassica oleracea TaxID=3712 RepID=A0A3P6F7J7_BRAOL|nr:unnamed protein product [Brassica oleracea]
MRTLIRRPWKASKFQRMRIRKQMPKKKKDLRKLQTRKTKRRKFQRMRILRQKPKKIKDLRKLQTRRIRRRRASVAAKNAKLKQR